MESGNVRYGTVKWFDERRGYGFLIPEGSNRDVFLHAGKRRPDLSIVKRHPKQGDTIVYELRTGEKGVFAAYWEFADLVPGARQLEAPPLLRKRARKGIHSPQLGIKSRVQYIE